MGHWGQEDRSDPGRQQWAPLECPLLMASAPGASTAHPELRLMPAEFTLVTHFHRKNL